MSKKIGITLDNHKVEKCKELFTEANIIFNSPLPITTEQSFIAVEVSDIEYIAMKLKIATLLKHMELYFQKQRKNDTSKNSG
jgi:hypothetical protein